jgi:heme/copper-type cytochrome/quinol oxidase subunit 2
VKNPHTPKFNAEDVTKIVADAEGQYRVLCAVLAGTGLWIPQ